MLEVATEGCCKGHPCDQCTTCRKGRCCRRDNPDYKLPELGEWDGPIYGELGALNDDGEKVECHCCGAWFIALGSHIVKHDLTEHEYKAIFGLALSKSLFSRFQHDRWSALHEGTIKKMLPLARATSPVPHFTAEQRSAYSNRGLNTSPFHTNRGRLRKGHPPTASQWQVGQMQGVPTKTEKTSRYVGVCLSNHGRRWIARLRHGSEREYLGTFHTEEEAARAYDAKARELYGDAARVNFPEEVQSHA